MKTYINVEKCMYGKGKDDKKDSFSSIWVNNFFLLKSDREHGPISDAFWKGLKPMGKKRRVISNVKN